MNSENIILGEHFIDFLLYENKNPKKKGLSKVFFRTIFPTVTNEDLDWHTHEVLRRITVLNNIEKGDWVYFDSDNVSRLLTRKDFFYIPPDTFHRLFIPVDTKKTKLCLLIEEYAD